MNGIKRFIAQGDGTAKDTETGLVWCLTDSFQILHDWLDFTEAMSFVDDCNRKDFLGFHDWRMPEQDEAVKLHFPDQLVLGRSSLELHIDPVFEPGGASGCWALPFDQQAAFYFSYQSGLCQHFDKDFSQGAVRLVRLWGD